MAKSSRREKFIVKLICGECGGKIKSIKKAQVGGKMRTIAQCTQCGREGRRPKDLFDPFFTDNQRPQCKSNMRTPSEHKKNKRKVR
jgi:hypothetical protein